jgi:hypothetical protein
LTKVLEEYIVSIFRVKSEPSKNPVETGGETVEVICANISVNRMARRLEEVRGKYAEVKNVTARGEYREVHCSGECNSPRGM